MAKLKANGLEMGWVWMEVDVMRGYKVVSGDLSFDGLYRSCSVRRSKQRTHKL